MREIKFRGKRTANGEWVYGGYFKNHQGNSFIVNYISSDLENVGVIPVDPKTVGQFTGLYDWKGREIYKGDVIKGETTYPMEILINEGLTKIKFKTERSVYEEPLFQDYIKEDELEKIGNIFDNPELLEVEQCKD